MTHKFECGQGDEEKEDRGMIPLLFHRLAWVFDEKNFNLANEFHYILSPNISSNSSSSFVPPARAFWLTAYRSLALTLDDFANQCSWQMR